MAHVVETVPNVSRFVAKISDTNEPSMCLFKSLGFQVSPNETESSSTTPKRAFQCGTGVPSVSRVCVYMNMYELLTI